MDIYKHSAFFYTWLKATLNQCWYFKHENIFLQTTFNTSTFHSMQNSYYDLMCYHCDFSIWNLYTLPEVNFFSVNHEYICFNLIFSEVCWDYNEVMRLQSKALWRV